MQRAGPPPGSFPLLAERLPIPFQCFPNGFPILRRRLHDYFFGLLLDEPRSQRSQLFRVAVKHPPLKLVFAFDFNVGHNYSQHLLVNIDSRYPVRHRLLLAGSGERAAITLTRVAGYRRSPGEDNDAPLFPQTPKLNESLKHARSGSDRWTVSNSPLINAPSPLRAVAILPVSDFHKVSRAEGPQRTDGMSSACRLSATTIYENW